MKEFVYTKDMLDGNDRVSALIWLLMAKEIITEEEIEAFFDKVVELKNRKLKEEREQNPGMSLFYDILMGGKEDKE